MMRKNTRLKARTSETYYASNQGNIRTRARKIGHVERCQATLIPHLFNPTRTHTSMEESSNGTVELVSNFFHRRAAHTRGPVPVLESPVYEKERLIKGHTALGKTQGRS